jgi:small subunit ribosomal protein S20
VLFGVASTGRPTSTPRSPAVPNSISAKKRVRQNAKSRSLNLWRKRQIKDLIKSFLAAVQAQDVKTAEAEYRKTCGILDKVSCTSTMHRNTAARRKSRLARRLNALKTSTA